MNKPVVQINPVPPKKRKCWVLEVEQKVYLTVDFGEELTREQAIESFNMDVYDDIVDEEVLSQWAGN